MRCDPHPLRPRREQAGRADARLEHVRPAGLQHREPGGRPDRAARRLADHAARRLRAALARADREADAQARERPAGDGARAGESVERELAPDKVAAPPDRRASCSRSPRSSRPASPTSGRRRSSSRSSAPPETLDSLEELVRPHGVKELVRTGRVGLRAPHVPPDAPPARSSAGEKGHDMATMHREGNVDLLTGKVAVIGYGSQGHAHALNLHDSGVDVQVGLRDGSPSRESAEAAGLAVAPIAEAVRDAQLVALLLPDQVQPSVYERTSPRTWRRGRAPLRARLQRPLRAHRAAGGPRRDHGRARRGPGTSCGGSTPRATGRPRSRPSPRTRAVMRSSSRSRTRPRSAPPAPGCSRRPSPRRRRPTSSASRPSSAEA